jgi:hypothetical protein
MTFLISLYKKLVLLSFTNDFSYGNVFLRHLLRASVRHYFKRRETVDVALAEKACDATKCQTSANFFYLLQKTSVTLSIFVRVLLFVRIEGIPLLLLMFL